MILDLMKRRCRRKKVAIKQNEGIGTIAVSRVHVDGDPGIGSLWEQRGMVVVRVEGSGKV